MKECDLIYPDLSYQIVGILYDVYNKVGHGHKEKFYQNAISIALKNKNVQFKEQVYSPMEYQGKKIGRYFLDFLVKDKIILEIKKDSFFRSQNIDQIYSYLLANKLKLGILANFTRSGVKCKRVINIK